MADIPYLALDRQYLCTSARNQEWRKVWPVAVANSTPGVDDLSAEGVADVSSRTWIETECKRTGLGHMEYL
jgi:hypothetical protein